MPGAMRKMAVYLGLVEGDDYDDYEDDLDDRDRRPAREERRTESRQETSRERQPEQRERYEPRSVRVTESRSVRTFRDDPTPIPERNVIVAPTSVDLYTIRTIHPHTYNDARRIGEDFRSGVPVIMNLTEMEDGDAKRIVDFAAGLVFGLHGTIERITNKVFLLSPANVDVAAEARAQLAQDGFFNQS